jgi:uncharacterized MAPEG superfamily protein
MTTELTMLSLSVALGLVQIILAAHAASLQVGYRWTATAREARRPLVGVAGRLERAARNFGETFPFFAAVVVVAHLTNRHTRGTEVGTWMYFTARLAYVPLYALAVPLVRSLVWNVATVGIVLVLASLVWP